MRLLDEVKDEITRRLWRTFMLFAVIVVRSYVSYSFWDTFKNQTDPVRSSAETELRDAGSEDSFKAEKIKADYVFIDSMGARRHVILDQDGEERYVYLTDDLLTKSSAIKLLNMAGGQWGGAFVSDYDDSESKYIVVEYMFGDDNDFLIADEIGNIIVDGVGTDPEWWSYIFTFEQWQTADSFWAGAFAYSESMPEYRILIDARTGNIIKKEEVQ